MEWFQGITQPARYCSGWALWAKPVTALFGLLFLPVLASGAQLLLNDADFTVHCILIPDALVHRSDEFFCGDNPVYIRCHAPHFSNKTRSFTLSLAFGYNNYPDFPQCIGCDTVLGNSTMQAMEPVFSSDWLFSATAAILTGMNAIKDFHKGMRMPRVLLSPFYAFINSSLVMPENHTGDRRFRLSGHYPAGLPYGRYWLQLTDLTQNFTSKPLPYDLQIRLDSEHNGNSATEFQLFANRGTVLPYDFVPILAGPILRNMTLTPGQPSCANNPLLPIGRHEHLGNIEYHFEPEPEVAVQWLEVNFPDIVGPLSATTSTGQNLNSNCTNIPPAGTWNCTLSLAGQPPLNWLLLRAGTLLDAETLNLTDLTAFWTIRQFSPDARGYRWQPAAVPATGYQLYIDCPDDREYNDFVVATRLGSDTGDTVHTCNLTLTPQYNQQLWERHSLKTEIQLRLNRSSSVTPLEAMTVSELTETPSMMTTPAGTTLPDEDKTAWEEWGRWTTVVGAFGVVSGVVLATVGITYGVMKMRRETIHAEKP